MTSNFKEKKNTHLTKEERNIIEFMLKESYPLTYIANTLSRDLTTISKEIKKHRKLKYPERFNNQNNLCIYRRECKKFDCNVSKNCFDIICNNLKKSPYVCNGCEKRCNCRNVKYYYDARIANNDYKDMLSNSRFGVRLSKEQEENIEAVVFDLIKNKNQSVNEIYINNPDLLFFSKQTFYSYINQGLFHLKNVDLRRKVSYKPRYIEYKRIRPETKIRINRTYKDFLEFIDKNPKMNIVEMDTVEGVKGGKVFLTFCIRKHNLLLIYLIDDKTTQSVNKVFDNLKITLGETLFKQIFRIILTDNGSEFFDPDTIEKLNGKQEINLFYCDPCASWQKGKLEKLHEYIRYILPKGSTFDYLLKDDVHILMSNINNSSRLSCGKYKSPYNSFKEKYGQNILDKLNISHIEPNNVNLSKRLLTNHTFRKKIMIKLINDLNYYYQVSSHKYTLDNNIKKIIIEQFLEDSYLYDIENLFYNAKQTVQNYLDIRNK